MRKFLFGALVVLGVCLLPLASGDGRAQDKEKEVKLASGLRYVDLKEGTGAEVKKGDTVDVHYTGWLFNDEKVGKKFDSSVDRNMPFTFTVGKGVIQGWSEGVAGMKVGGKRKLIIPPDLAYGAKGAGDAIPPNATLLFEVEVLKIK
jgi:FKBP-type peptidyl-prolyl cis-trans isomerase